MSVIEVEKLTKDYGNGKGVFDIDLYVDEGEVYGFLGPNGAGKSTTIRHLMGFSRPDSGETRINGKNTFNKYYDLLKDVGYLPGEIALPKGLTGGEFIKMMKDLRGMKGDMRTKELIDTFELDYSGDTKSMSLGQKRKLAIVVAFMHDPKILILDEPTSGLDPIMQKKFIEFVVNEKKAGKTILLSSHIFSEVDATCDKIAIIKDGRIVDRFVTADFKHRSKKCYEIDFDDEETARMIVKKDYISDASVSGKQVVITIDEKDTDALMADLSLLPICDFKEEIVSLQDHFMSFYKEDLTYERV